MFLKSDVVLSSNMAYSDGLCDHIVISPMVNQSPIVDINSPGVSFITERTGPEEPCWQPDEHVMHKVLRSIVCLYVDFFLC